MGDLKASQWVPNNIIPISTQGVADDLYDMASQFFKKRENIQDLNEMPIILNL